MMAQYIQVVEQSNSKTDNLQPVYPAIIDGQQQTVSYVLNSSDQNNQPIIVTSNDQYMVIDNAVSLQNQQFEVQQAPQELYFMDGDESQPVLLNHQLTGLSLPTTSEASLPTGQKVIMVQQGQHSQPTMVIQQPAIIHKQVPVINQKPPQRLSGPVLLTQRGVALHQTMQRPANRLNVVRAAAPRPQARANSPGVAAIRPAPESPARNNGPRPMGVNRGNLPRPLRAGVIQTGSPLVQAKVRQDSPLPQSQSGIRLFKQSPAQTGNKESVKLSDGTIMSAAEFTEMMKNKEREIPVKTPAQKPMRVPFNKRMANRMGMGKGVQQASPTTTTPPANQTPPQQKQPPVLQKPAPPLPKHAQQKPCPQLPKPAFGQQYQSPAYKNAHNQNAEPPKNNPTAKIIMTTGNKRLPAVLRNFVPPPEIKEIISKTQHTPEFSDSIRMFVLLANGEQRLITFTSPKDDCTIQEILEQVGVPIQPDTKIAVSKTNTDGIDLAVTVDYSDDEEEDEPVVQQQQGPAVDSDNTAQVVPELLAPEPEAPKYVAGRLAVCTHCGFLSDDFNKCIRCKSKLPSGIKSVPVLSAGRKLDLLKNKPTISLHLKNGNSPKPPLKKKQPEKKKPVEQEPVILTLSSDEEEEADDRINPKVDQLIKKAESEMHEFAKKEPTISDINKTFIDDGKSDSEIGDVSTTMFCRTVRIGSYRFTPVDNIMITSRELIIKVPLPKDPSITKTISIKRNGIVKVLVNFNKVLPIIFYYVIPNVSEQICKDLQMEEGKEPYFNPLAPEEEYKRITLLPDLIAEENKITFRNIYAPSVLEELCTKEANNILVRTCPKEVTKPVQPNKAAASNQSVNNSDVRQLLIYPPGKGGLSINTEDYLCLAQDQFLNDVIIDFYLKYLVQNMMPESQNKVHVFSTFFYKRLTTKPAKPTKKTHPTELDPTLSAAQKRHCRVKNWTKNVNIFEKNFIIVPINENAHWFLAIICFPGMDGPHTFDNKPYKILPVEKPQTPVTTIGNVTITQMESKKPPTVACDEDNLSDKDEAEGDESELDSSEENDETAALAETPKTRPPIKQPCILIFDSLAGASRSRVVATLRDYLTCEYKVKMDKEKVFNKDVIKGCCPKVPQQTNYTDCGLYLLQYVESFFTMPVTDYFIPIKELKSWFEEIVVTRKREEISDLIKELMVGYNKDINLLPNIIFPTLNGELVEHAQEEEEAMCEEEEEEFDEVEEAEEDEAEKCTDSENSDKSLMTNFASPVKPTSESSSVNDSFTVEAMDSTDAKPDQMESPTQSDRDTMTYLKTKRIVRHKPGEGGDMKKIRLTQE